MIATSSITHPRANARPGGWGGGTRAKMRRGSIAGTSNASMVLLNTSTASNVSGASCGRLSIAGPALSTQLLILLSVGA